jgi:hypothetical protein
VTSHDSYAAVSLYPIPGLPLTTASAAWHQLPRTALTT